MTAERYKAELEALAREECDRCTVEYPVAEMMRCAFCDGLYCVTCSHHELDCCWSAQCLYQAATGFRQRAVAAAVVLENPRQVDWQKIDTAITILRGGKR